MEFPRFFIYDYINPYHRRLQGGTRPFLQWHEGDAILLSAANILPGDDIKYFGPHGDRMHMMFNFFVNQNLFYALASADIKPVVKALEAT